jgi:hypothetical protein
MLAARVEPKNGPQENKKIGNFKPVALGQFQTGVDTLSLIGLFLSLNLSKKTYGREKSSSNEDRFGEVQRR